MEREKTEDRRQMTDDRDDKAVEIYINHVKKWIKEFVIELNLCPFASHPFENDLIKYLVIDFESIEEFVTGYFSELQVLRNVGMNEVSTTLIIVPKGLQDFLFYLDVFQTCQDVLDRSEVSGVIQLASFHPEYQFDRTKKGDVTNYTNRSPYPMIHLLRCDEVEEAIRAYGDAEGIPKRNQTLMRSLGAASLLQITRSD